MEAKAHRISQKKEEWSGLFNFQISYWGPNFQLLLDMLYERFDHARLVLLLLVVILFMPAWAISDSAS